MIRITEIQDNLLHLVGWEQAYDPAKQIDASLTQSESGLMYQHAHPLLTLDNVRSIMPDDYEYQYPEWVAGTYAKGAKVRHNGSVWIATQNTTDEPVDGSAWKVYDITSDYIERLTRQGIAAVAQNFIQFKQLQSETKSLLERRTFFDGAGRLKATINNKNKICGFEIVPVRAMGVTAKIERVGLQFAGGTGKVTLYLFHSSMTDPVKTFELDYEREGMFQWFTLDDCYLPYMGANDAGGAWFLCYNQDELPLGMEAINVSKDWSRDPCGTCNIGSVEAWRQLTKYLQISPFCVNAPTTFAQYPEMWDIAQTGYTNTTSYGLNCEVTVGCDLTDFICEQRQLFATTLQKQVAAIALRTLAMNPDVKVNRNQSNASRMDILYELDGNSQGRASGIGQELKEAYKSLSLDTSGIDRICLTCNNHGVKYRTV